MTSPSEIALFGHTGSHTSQLMQTSVIFSAIALPYCDARAGRASITSQSADAELRLFHFVETEFYAAFGDGFLDAILVCRRTDEQDDHTLERSVARFAESVDDEIGRRFRIRAAERHHVARQDAARDSI